jgi:hypothetical protein
MPHLPPITASGFVKSGPVIFIDDSERAGLSLWTHKMGSPEKSYILETKGSGVGLIDYDNDGWLDIYLVNGSTVEALEGKQTPSHAALFHNNHDGTFTDVAARAGVTNDRWGMGVAIADYDNDGWPDIFVSNFGKTASTTTTTMALSPTWPRKPAWRWATGRAASPGATTTVTGGWIFLWPATCTGTGRGRRPGRARAAALFAAFAARRWPAGHVG